MREFFIQITDIVTNGELTAHTTPSIINKAGIAGEHNASRLIFCLPESWDTEWEYRVECVNSTNEGTVSDTLTVTERDGKSTVEFDIPQGMTQSGQGNYTLQGVKREGDEIISIYRSATVDLYFAKSPKLGARIVNAIENVLSGLFAKINNLVERFENGEFNGKDGEKGEKGDKGDKGEDGVFSDELADEITENTAARHTHNNKELLDSLTESMIGTLDVYHELPETANDGDICIYTPANVPTVADSGKLIYVEWDVFNKTFAEEDFTQFAITFFDANGAEVGFIYATAIDNGDGRYNTFFQYIKGNEQWDIQFIGGVFDAEGSAYTNGETTICFTKAPTSFTLPCFSSLVSDHYNINGDVFYAPIRLMVYRDGWYEYTSAATVDVGIGHGHELPENAKEGDLYLYAPQNTITLADSGKRIYFDWAEFSKPVDREEGEEVNVNGIGYLTEGFAWEIHAFRNTYGNNEIGIIFYIGNTIHTYAASFAEGELFAETSRYEHIDENGESTITYYNSISELPLYLDLPEFISMEYQNTAEDEFFFCTKYRLMVYQGGEWVEAVEKDVTETQMQEYVTAALTEINARIDEVEGGIDEIELTTETAMLHPNTHYLFSEAETLTLEFIEGAAGKRNEYLFTFISGATPTVLTLPSSVQWVNELTVEANKRYEISIVDNIGLWCAVEVNV